MVGTQQPQRMVLEVGNRTDRPLRVWMEPWAEDLFLPPGQVWHVVSESPRSDLAAR